MFESPASADPGRNTDPFVREGGRRDETGAVPLTARDHPAPHGAQNAAEGQAAAISEAKLIILICI